jgi:methylase of polypeptide subunit release factors
LYLGQTGIVATKGYELTQLRDEQTLLQRQEAELRTQLAAAQDLEKITKRAESALGLRPYTQEQVRYITITAEPTPSP